MQGTQSETQFEAPDVFDFEAIEFGPTTFDESIRSSLHSTSPQSSIPAVLPLAILPQIGCFLRHFHSHGLMEFQKTSRINNTSRFSIFQIKYQGTMLPVFQK